jgi:hypothetical protein
MVANFSVMSATASWGWFSVPCVRWLKSMLRWGVVFCLIIIMILFDSSDDYIWPNEYTIKWEHRGSGAEIIVECSIVAYHYCYREIVWVRKLLYTVMVSGSMCNVSTNKWWNCVYYKLRPQSVVKSVVWNCIVLLLQFLNV